MLGFSPLASAPLADDGIDAEVVVNLTAIGVVTAAPVLGSPAIEQEHVLLADGVVTGAPVLGSPAIEQVHDLAATGAATGTPTVGSPALSADPGVTPLTADSIATDTPTLGTPALGEVAVTQLVADSASGWTNSSLAIDSDEGTSASDSMAPASVGAVLEIEFEGLAVQDVQSITLKIAASRGLGVIAERVQFNSGSDLADGENWGEFGTDAADLVYSGTLAEWDITEAEIESGLTLYLQAANTASKTRTARVHDVVVTLTSPGVLTTSASLLGSSSIVAQSLLTALGSASLLGSSSIVAQSLLTASGSASLLGSSSIVAQSLLTAVGSASLLGSGSIVAQGSRVAAGSASLLGSGSIVAQGSRVALGSASLLGSSSIVAQSLLTASGSAILLGSGSIVAQGSRVALGSAGLLGSGSIVARLIPVWSDTRPPTTDQWTGVDPSAITTWVDVDPGPGARGPVERP